MVRAASRLEDRGVRTLVLKTGAPDDRDGHQPAAPAHDRRHDGPQFRGEDAERLHPPRQAPPSSERRHNIAQLRQWLAVPAPKPEVDDVEDKAAASKPLAPACPCCGGRMVIIETFARGATPRHRPTTPIRRLKIDTS